MTGHTTGMKLAISLPDALFREIEAVARRERLTRSGVMAMAARDYLARRRVADDPTEAWNRALTHGGGSADDPVAQALRRRGKAVVRGTRGKW